MQIDHHQTTPLPIILSPHLLIFHPPHLPIIRHPSSFHTSVHHRYYILRYIFDLKIVKISQIDGRKFFNFANKVLGGQRTHGYKRALLETMHNKAHKTVDFVGPVYSLLLVKTDHVVQFHWTDVR